jgi:hypothetical protein
LREISTSHHKSFFFAQMPKKIASAQAWIRRRDAVEDKGLTKKSSRPILKKLKNITGVQHASTRIGWRYQA